MTNLPSALKRNGCSESICCPCMHTSPAFSQAATDHWSPTAATESTWHLSKLTSVPLSNGDGGSKQSFPLPRPFALSWYQRVRLLAQGDEVDWGKVYVSITYLWTWDPSGVWQLKTPTFLASHKELNSQSQPVQLRKHQDLISKGKIKAYSLNRLSLASELLFSAKGSEEVQDQITSFCKT